MKFLNIRNLESYILTFFNLLKIYLIINRRFKNNKKLKFILFYFPVKTYQENILDLVKKMKKNKNIFIFLIYNKYSSSGISKQKNSLLIDFGYLRFVPFSNIFLNKINLFISNDVAYIYPPKSTNIYISHDITDIQMVNKEMEKKVFSAFLKIDYIFLSSDIVVKDFIKKFKLFFKKKKLRTPKLINTGYLKLDHVKKKLNLFKNKRDSIVIAPTARFYKKEHNISTDLENIIDNLLKFTKEKIIYRPHPVDLTKGGDNNFVEGIINKFNKNKNFSADLSKSYLNSYSKAKFLITDFSSTAFTFAYSTLCPVVFYSKNEKKLNITELVSSAYYKDRLKVGYITNNVIQILTIIKKISLTKSKLRIKIINLRKKRIKYLNQSLNKTYKEITNIIKS
jgi:hypothetical protein